MGLTQAIYNCQTLREVDDRICITPANIDDLVNERIKGGGADLYPLLISFLRHRFKKMSKWQGFEQGRFSDKVDGFKNQRVLCRKLPLKLKPSEPPYYKRIFKYI